MGRILDAIKKLIGEELCYWRKRIIWNANLSAREKICHILDSKNQKTPLFEDLPFGKDDKDDKDDKDKKDKADIINNEWNINTEKV